MDKREVERWLGQPMEILRPYPRPQPTHPSVKTQVLALDDADGS